MLRFFKSGWSVLEIFQKIFCISFMMTEGWWAAIFCFLTWSRTKVPKNKVTLKQLWTFWKVWKRMKTATNLFLFHYITNPNISLLLHEERLWSIQLFLFMLTHHKWEHLEPSSGWRTKSFPQMHECDRLQNRSPKKNLSHRSITSSFSVVVIANCLSPLPTGWALTFISTMH